MQQCVYQTMERKRCAQFYVTARKRVKFVMCSSFNRKICLFVSIVFSVCWLNWTYRRCFTVPVNETHANAHMPAKRTKTVDYNDGDAEAEEPPHDPSAMKYKLAFDDLNFQIGRWDAARVLKIFDFALVGESFEKVSAASLVCLATQASVDRLHSLPQVAYQWTGPISLAIYVSGNKEFAIAQHYITYLRMCFANVRNNVAFHLAVAASQQPRPKERILDFVEEFNCQYPDRVLRRLMYLRSPDSKHWRHRNVYPQNHMRNLARKGCQNSFVFLTDIDIVPSTNIAEELSKFLKNASCATRCAYVIPTFEIDSRAKFPSNKDELMRLSKKGLARPFHEKVFIYNQYATNFTRWFSSRLTTTAISISHTVTNFEFLYEPFYVAEDTVPMHDERFVGYGFTRNSQVFEMYVAGYTFHVLTPAFTCHWGLQHKKYRPAWREHQNNENRRRFNTFKAEIFARYNNSNRKEKWPL